MELRWGLIISTYNRERILPLCIQLALEQTRPPVEIVVIDASQNWQTTREHVMDIFAGRTNGIRWVYEPAAVRSLTMQRNQGIQHATADVLFLLDDDSLMYPNCAMEIMRIYEADVDARVAGVQASATPISPVDFCGDAKKATGAKLDTDGGLGAVIKQWMWRTLFLMDAEKLFIPYDGCFPEHAMPPELQSLAVRRAFLFQGFRMTYRRSVLLDEPFEPRLRYYAAGEDLDQSYRASRHGCLLTASDAKLHHHESASGRPPRFKASCLGCLNQALLLRTHSANLGRMKWSYYQLNARRFVAEMFKDALSHRWTFPQTRGILAGCCLSYFVFTMPDRDLDVWYLDLQDSLS